MSDITKCVGTNCHVKHACWRYLAPAGQCQSMMENQNEEPCQYFLRMTMAERREVAQRDRQV